MLKSKFSFVFLVINGLFLSLTHAGQHYLPPYGSDRVVYGRTYSSLHLKRHPRQQITAIQVEHELGDYAVVPEEIKGYTAASINGVLRTRREGTLLIQWACREASSESDQYLACIPKHPHLQTLMGTGSEFKVYTLQDSSSDYPSQEYIEFPGLAAFHPLSGDDDSIVLLGSSIPESSDDTLFRLYRY